MAGPGPDLPPVAGFLAVHPERLRFTMNAKDPDSPFPGDDRPTLDSQAIPARSSSDTQAAPTQADGGGPDTEQAGDRIGRYQLVKKLGEGGMGAVYLAEQTQPVQRQVALKVIKSGMDSRQVIARFEAERAALSMMNHIYIARVLDAGSTSTGRPYFVMERVEGEPVTRFCDSQKLKIRRRLELFKRICAAVQHAHQKGIIHRDLKPTNILVSSQDNIPLPKVIDFGVAKAITQHPDEETAFTMLGQIVGTLEYMSPEQARLNDASVDTRSDIYSLGVILYELMTGTTPLGPPRNRKSDYLEVLSRIKHEEPLRPSTSVTDTRRPLEDIARSRGVEPRRLAAQLRGELDLIILKALEKDPVRRYQTVQELSEDVGHYLNAEPISARPPTRLYLLRKFVRRNRSGVVTATAVLVTLIAGLALTAWYAVKATRAEQQLAEQFQQLQQSVRLEKQNEVLSRKLARQAEAKKATLAAEINSLIKRGQWAEGLARMEEYEQNHGTPPVELRVLRLNAIDGLSDREQLQREILALEADPESGTVESELRLWRGYGFLYDQNRSDDSVTLIRSAIAGALPPDDRLFAEGLIADSLPEAIGFYRQALLVSPFHSRARLQLAATLIFLGRYEEALAEIRVGQTLFVNDPRFYMAETISHALADEVDRALGALQVVEQRFPEAQTDNARSLIQMSQTVNRQFREYDRAGLLDWMAILPDAWDLMKEDVYESMSLPEFQRAIISRAYGNLVTVMILQRFATHNKKHRNIIDSCQSGWAVHQDNLFKTFEGWSWLALQNPRQAAAAFEMATTSDGLFPDIRSQAHYGLFLGRLKMYEQTADPTDMESAIQALQQYLEAGPFEMHRAATMLDACTAADRWDLARSICDQVVARGMSSRDWKLRLLESGLAAGKTGLALELCESLVQEYPDDRRIRDRHQTILEALGNR